MRILLYVYIFYLFIYFYLWLISFFTGAFFFKSLFLINQIDVFRHCAMILFKVLWAMQSSRIFLRSRESRHLFSARCKCLWRCNRLILADWGSWIRNPQESLEESLGEESGGRIPRYFRDKSGLSFRNSGEISSGWFYSALEWPDSCCIRSSLAWHCRLLEWHFHRSEWHFHRLEWRIQPECLILKERKRHCAETPTSSC